MDITKNTFFILNNGNGKFLGPDGLEAELLKMFGRNWAQNANRDLVWHQLFREAERPEEADREVVVLQLPERVAGSALVHEIARLAAANGWRATRARSGMSRRRSAPGPVPPLGQKLTRAPMP